MTSQTLFQFFEEKKSVSKSMNHIFWGKLQLVSDFNQLRWSYMTKTTKEHNLHTFIVYLEL